MTILKRFLPLIIITLFIITLFSPTFFKGLLPIPADTIVGLYHPWRDLYSKDYPSGIPYKNFLVTDPVRQQYVWRELAVSAIKAGHYPGWNPYSLSGSPLAGNPQTAAFYPLNVLYFILDFPVAWTVQVILQSLLGGLFMFLFLRSYRLHSAAQTLGTIAWAGSGFFVSWLTLNTLVQTAIWLPLELLAIDQLRRKPLLSTFGLAAFTALSFLAGAPQIFLFVQALVAVYFLARVVQFKKLSLLLWGTVAAFLSLVLAAVQVYPFLKFLSNSSRTIEVTDFQNPGWFLPWPHLIQFLAPDYFGNPTTLNYFGVWNYMEFLGYIGVLPLLTALFAIFFRRDKKTLFFSLVILVCLLFALPTPLAELPFKLSLPVISYSQPTRLLVLIDFALSVLAALGLDIFLRRPQERKKLLLISLFVLFGLSGAFLVAYRSNWSVSLRNLILPASLTFTTILLLFLATRPSFLKIAVSFLLALTFFDLSRVFFKFEPFTSSTLIFPDTKITSFLKEKGFLTPIRIASLDPRILPPNFATYYRIRDVAGYDSFAPTRYAEFLVALDRGRPDISRPWGVNRILSAKNYSHRLFAYLRVDYLLTFTRFPDTGLGFISEKPPILTEGQTRLYAVTSSPTFNGLFYFPSVVQRADSRQEALNKLFHPAFMPGSEAVVEGWPYENNLKESTATLKLLTFADNFQKVDTETTLPGLLVFLESFDPSWQAQIDGTPTKIYPTNYAFMGIYLPAGRHQVTFSFKP